MTTNAIKRVINKDMKEIRKMNLQNLGIHIHFDEDNVLNAHAIIIGPKGTPFENGILYFVINFPGNYPFSSPKVKYLSHSKYRIHPNLYVGKPHENFLGKVCLSIINTWSGPKWTTIMHIGSVLLSIQSLLCENPLHNEPGLENELGPRNDTYNQIVEYETFHNLIMNNGFKIPKDFQVFEPIIKEHLIKEKDTIIEKLTYLSKNNPKKKKVTHNMYNIMIFFDYPLMLKELNKQLNLI